MKIGKNLIDLSPNPSVRLSFFPYFFRNNFHIVMKFHTGLFHAETHWSKQDSVCGMHNYAKISIIIHKLGLFHCFYIFSQIPFRLFFFLNIRKFYLITRSKNISKLVPPLCMIMHHLCMIMHNLCTIMQIDNKKWQFLKHGHVIYR